MFMFVSCVLPGRSIAGVQSGDIISMDRARGQYRICDSASLS